MQYKNGVILGERKSKVRLDQPTMMKSALFLAALATCEAATTVSVLDFGSSIRRTDSKNAETSVHGVASFWGALHHNRLQNDGMTMIPDMFSRPSGSIVIGLMGSGVDLDTMPTVNKLVTSEEVARGQMVVNGNKGRALLNKIGPSKKVDASGLVQNCKQTLLSQSRPSAMQVKVDEHNAEKVDGQIALLIKELAGQNVVVHLVVEEEEGAARRRLSSRRLEDEQEENNSNDENENDDANNNNQNNNAFYGYGYYNAYGEWVTPYKTMFQIQYFNIVLWTSVGLTVVLFYIIYLMLDMPLEADSMLFGEGAKMMGD